MDEESRGDVISCSSSRRSLLPLLALSATAFGFRYAHVKFADSFLNQTHDFLYSADPCSYSGSVAQARSFGVLLYSVSCSHSRLDAASHSNLSTKQSIDSRIDPLGFQKRPIHHQLSSLVNPERLVNRNRKPTSQASYEVQVPR